MKTTSLQAINDALTQANVRYIVVGGLAVVAHGYLRATQDADIVIELLPDNIERTFRALTTLGYRPSVPVTAQTFADPVNRSKWAAEKNMTVLQFWSEQHHETPIDVFVEAPFDFETEWSGAYQQELEPSQSPIRFAALDTLIAMKARTGRPQDLADIEQLRWIQKNVRDNA